MIRVKIANRQEAVPLDFAKLRETARVVLEGEGVKEAQIILAFVDNATIHRLNKQFLNHDEPTDVLSFPMSAANARKLEGELVIGAEVAKAQAAERGHEVGAELGLYVIHGLLHLCGYDDHEDDDIRKMRERERHYLRELSYPDISDT
jgi:probable rRNA maturation factor